MKTPELMTSEELAEWEKGAAFRRAHVCRSCKRVITPGIFMGEDFCCELCRKALYGG